MEQLDFTVAKTYHIVKIVFDWVGAIIEVTFNDNLGGTLVVSYTGQTATNFMLAINTANLSTKSLHRRILEKLVLAGKLPSGTITGVP